MEYTPSVIDAASTGDGRAEKREHCISDGGEAIAWR